MNRLFYGDNIDVLRESVRDESVDLIYLDPPFNSNANYNVLFRSPRGEHSSAQIEAFEDTWHWNEHAELAFSDVEDSDNAAAATLLRAMRSALGENDMMAYLAMMAARLLELHRVLKSTGSLYLHCDPTASHYLRILLDAVFGPQNFKSELVWKRSHAHNSARRWGPIHDTIFFYTKSDEFTWNRVFQPYDQSYIDQYFKFDDNDQRGRYWTGDLTGAGTRQGPSGEPWRGFNVRAKGRHWAYSPDELDRLDKDRRIYWPPTKSAMPKLKRYLREARGIPAQDVLTDVPSLQRMSSSFDESLGYPTQKPVALLERIISASSNEGDVVLDPFCGCGTTIHAAQKLNRQWLGIDITHLAIALIERRLRDAFPDVAFQVEGTPKDMDGARDLATRNKYQFQWWATSLVGAVPAGGKKKGMDRGIDGYINFRDAEMKPQAAIVSVKGGENVNSAMIRDLKGTMEREKAPMGVFITLADATREMIREAASAGFYETGGLKYPRVQIVTIAELLAGEKVERPFGYSEGFRKATRVQEDRQGRLL